MGDSLFFGAIKNIGPRKTLLMETLSSPFTGVISFLYFGNSISLVGWIGMFIVVVCIMIVVQESSKEISETKDNLIDVQTLEPLESVKNTSFVTSKLFKGYVYAIGAMFC